MSQPQSTEPAFRFPLSPLTLDAVQAEAVRAHVKHGDRSLLNPEMPWPLKLAALVEEVGEVAHELTYDQAGDPTKLVTELIQVASVALTWVESIEGDHGPRLKKATPRDPDWYIAQQGADAAIHKMDEAVD